jgi:hypothetical protein
VASLHVAADEALGGALEVLAATELPEDWPETPAQCRAALTFTSRALPPLAEALGLRRQVPEGSARLTAEAEGQLGRTVSLRTTGEANVRIEGDCPQEIGGDYALELETADGSSELSSHLVLTDWGWSMGDREMVWIDSSQISVDHDRLVLSETHVTTPAGCFAGGMRVGQDDDGRVTYDGHFAAEELDTAAMESWAGRPMPEGRLALRGTFEGTGSERLTARAKGHLAVAVPSMDAGSAEGDLDVTLTALRPLEPQPAGRITLTATLRDGSVRQGDNALLTELGAALTLSPGAAAVADFSARALDGRVEGQVRTSDQTPGGLLCTITHERIDLARLPAPARPPAWLEATSADGRIRIEGRPGDKLKLQAAGRVAARLGNGIARQVESNYDLDGTLEGYDTAATAGFVGKARLEDGTVSGRYGTVAEKVRASILSLGRSADVSSLRGTVLGGQVQGLFRIDLPAGEAPRFRGGANVDDFELASLRPYLGEVEGEIRGTADLAYRFAGRGREIQHIHGRGSLVLRDSQITGVPLLGAILATLHLRPETARETDLDLVFESAGEVVTVLGGRVATPLAAISPQPGGTVNLRTRELDLRVAAGALDDLEGLVNVPILELLVPLSRRVSQLHVTGTWDSRDTVVIRKEPLKDLGQATAEFFRGVVRTGGDLGQSFVQPIQEMTP